MAVEMVFSIDFIDEDTKNKVFEKKSYMVATSWDDPFFTVQRLADFSKVLEAKKQSDLIDRQIEESGIDIEVDSTEKDIVFNYDILSALSGIPAKALILAPDKAIAYLSECLKFISESNNPKTDYKPIIEFAFRAAKREDIEAINAKIRKTKNKKKRIELKSKRALMKNTVWTLNSNHPIFDEEVNSTGHYKDIEGMPASHFISGMTIAEEINKIKGEMQAGVFINYAKLLSFVLREKGKGYDMELQPYRAELFLELPYSKAMQVTNFFLKGQNLLSRSLPTYLNLISRAQAALKPKKAKRI